MSGLAEIRSSSKPTLMKPKFTLIYGYEVSGNCCGFNGRSGLGMEPLTRTLAPPLPSSTWRLVCGYRRPAYLADFRKWITLSHTRKAATTASFSAIGSCPRPRRPINGSMSCASDATYAPAMFRGARCHAAYPVAVSTPRAVRGVLNCPTRLLERGGCGVSNFLLFKA